MSISIIFANLNDHFYQGYFHLVEHFYSKRIKWEKANKNRWRKRPSYTKKSIGLWPGEP
jgi:hypothetical protein